MSTSATLSRVNPTGVNVRNMIARGTSGNASAVSEGWKIVRIPFSAIAATSTATGAWNWVNPESGTVAAQVELVWTTAGTGTIDVGRGSDGTGTSAAILDGATMAVGVVSQTGSPATLGSQTATFLIGPGGTGTNNSIVCKHSDGIVSTAVGQLVIKYYNIGS